MTEVQVDRIGIERDVRDHVLRAALHVPRRDARVEPGPARDEGLDAVGGDHDARIHHCVTTGPSEGQAPATVSTLERYRLRADADLSARTPRLGGQRWLEARAVENVTHVTFRDAHLRSVRRPEDHACDAAGHPARALGTNELGKSA